MVTESKKVKNIVGERKQLSDEVKQVFYSQWYFSALRMLVQLPIEHSAEQFSQRLNLPADLINESLEFLLGSGLIKRDGKRLALGDAKTHIPAGDPFVFRHHLNWRQQASSKIYFSKEDELHFTGPLTIAEKDFGKVTAILHSAIQKCFKLVDPSPSETAACLLIDWYRFV